MGKDKKAARKGDKAKMKEKCCEKYLRKNKHCKGCPLRGECGLPAADG